LLVDTSNQYSIKAATYRSSLWGLTLRRSAQVLQFSDGGVAMEKVPRGAANRVFLNLQPGYGDGASLWETETQAGGGMNSPGAKW
jgi:hypothetical protein